MPHDLQRASEHAARLRAEVQCWLEQSLLMDGPCRNQGGEDEANYALTWFAHYLVSGEAAVLARFGSLLADLARWVETECVHGYEPEAEAHHGTEPFLLFLPRYLGLVPGDETARRLLADAAEHIGNWVPGLPEWYDHERDVFRSWRLGTRVVDASWQYRIELAEHLRFVHIALAAYRVLGDDRYLTWARRYGRRRAERLVATPDPVPLAWDLAGRPLGWDEVARRPRFHGMCALAHKVNGDPLGGVENHLASGAVQVWGDLYELCGDGVFHAAARRLVAPLVDQLADPFGDPAAAAVAHYRVAFADLDFDAAALAAIEAAPPRSDAPWVMLLPEEARRREPGLGKRADMLYWGEFTNDGGACPLREPSTAASALAWQISGDPAHAHQALAGAARKLGMARRVLRSGREHADMGGAICSVAAGHGRNWGTGAVTGCYGPLLLGCRDVCSAVVPLIRVRDGAGGERLPPGLLSLVRPPVGGRAGEVHFYHDATARAAGGAGQDAGSAAPAPGSGPAGARGDAAGGGLTFSWRRGPAGSAWTPERLAPGQHVVRRLDPEKT